MARSLSARSTKYSVKVKKEPAQEEPNTSSGLQPRQPSTSGMRGLISNDTNSSTSRVNTPVKVKTEVVEEDYQPPSSPMETDAISKPVSPDAMDIDVPLEGQFQDSASGSATAEAQRASAPEDTTHVEETVLLGHSQPPHKETRSIPQTDVGIADSVKTPARSTMPSFAEKKTLPITDPQQIAANDAPVNPPGDLATPSLAEEKAASTTGPQHVVADDALANSPGGVDAIQPVPKVNEVGPTDLGQTEPPRKDPGVTKPNDTFDQFCQAYPEYTGNRKHFENLCGQLDSLRRMELGLHPFLWDDYIVRSRRDFKSYTDECADEGIDPLPWSKYYVDAIPGPQFTRGVMNPATLEKYFAEQDRPLRSAFHPNISRFDPAAERGPPSTFSPFNDSSPRGRNNFRPRGSKQQRRKNAYNQPHGSTSSPLQHNAKQLAPPSTAFPATGPSPATNGGQPPVTSIAPPLPRRPLQAAPAPAPGPSPKPPAATAQQQPPRGPGQNRPPPDPAKKAALASSARPASNKPSLIPTGPRVGAGLTTTGLVKNPKIINNKKNNGSGNGTPAPSSTAAAANEKRPNGMPAPPPPVSSAGGGGGNAKGDKPKPKTMFALYKEQRKNRSRPGGSRAGSAVTDR
ncbi:hypothetical protein SLS55_001504 [Diplodia seriata]|uniref:Uncharacterized protein n=1 Tax=Diplodia seriata TaxID=420778 RepID=A0ABR3CS54_9PEZI